jgi:hypothetical protein
MSVTSDLNIYRIFADEFDAYLKSDTVFYNVGNNQTALTIGGLLHLRRALEARSPELSPDQQRDYENIDAKVDGLFTRWASNIERKAFKEVSFRLNVWRSALEELGEGYNSSVLQRLYLALLLPIVARVPDGDKYRQRLATLDTLLRAKVIPSEFILDPALTSAFPPDEFWFLYRKPRKA